MRLLSNIRSATPPNRWVSLNTNFLPHYPRLQQELPTIEELGREFALMSVVKLRIEIERALRDYAATQGFAPARPTSIGIMIQDLQRHGLAPAGADAFMDAGPKS